MKIKFADGSTQIQDSGSPKEMLSISKGPDPTNSNTLKSTYRKPSSLKDIFLRKKNLDSELNTQGETRLGSSNREINSRI